MPLPRFLMRLSWFALIPLLGLTVAAQSTATPAAKPVKSTPGAASAAAAVPPANVTGTWTGVSDQGPRFVFVLRSRGAQLNGYMVGLTGKHLPLAHPRLKGNRISGVIHTQWQGAPLRLDISGRLRTGKLHMQIATDDGSWSTEDIMHKLKPGEKVPRPNANGVAGGDSGN